MSIPSQPKEHEQPDAPDVMPIGFLTVVTIASFLFVFSWWIFCYPLLQKLGLHEKSKVDPGMGNALRAELIQKDEQELRSYKETSPGNYQIPIDEAMKEIIHESK